MMPMMSMLLLLMGCSMGVNSKSEVYSRSVSINKGDASKATVKKSIKIGNFSKIEATQGINIIFTQGGFTELAEVQTTPSAEKYLTIEVNKGVLQVHYRNNHHENINGPTIVRVQAPDLNEVDLTSAASLSVEGPLKLNGKLDIDLTSAASVNLNAVTATSLDIDQTSASTVTTGNLNLNTLSLDLTSASDANIGKVTAVKLSVETTSAADCKISGFNGDRLTAEATSGSKIVVTDIKATEVTAKASSGADIKLTGESGKVSTSSSSGGSVNRDKLYNPNPNANYKGNSGKSQKENSDKVPPRNPSL